MASSPQVAMQEALEAFSQADLTRADSVLAAAEGTGSARTDVDAALSLCCMRASIAAMRGAADVAPLMAPVAGTPAGAAASRYMEGLAALGKNSLQTARMKFEEAQRTDKGFKLAHLGLAAVLFEMKQYKACFAQYREALSQLGSEACPPVVRVGMGLCAFHLGNADEAKRFLERALEVNPDDELALFGLLVVYLDVRDTARVAGVVASLRNRLPHNALVLLKVAELMYFRALGDRRVAEVRPRVQQVLAEARRFGTPQESALADYQEGRLLLVTGDYAGAQPLLESALRAYPTLLAARIHYARLLHYVGREADALPLLRAINAEHPNQREVLQLLALYATRRGEHEAALKYCRLLTENLAQLDVHSWALASWCTRLNPGENESLLTQMVGVYRKLEQTPPWQLLANVAVVTKDVEALQAVADRELGGDFHKKPSLAVEYVPLLYNLALLREETDVARARQLYVLLVKRHSTFALAYLRLHELARREGQARQAAAWLALLAEVAPEDANVHTSLSALFFDAQHYIASLAALREARVRSVPVALAHGAFFLWNCQRSLTRSAAMLKTAKDRFVYVLSVDKDNILAAHGLACCLGLERQGDRCQTMLNGVNEVTPNSPYVRENLNVHMANVKSLSERYKQAVDYFLKVPARTPQQNSMLALCYACDGRYDEAIETLAAAVAESEAAEASPGDARGARRHARATMLTYNLAVVCCSAFLHRVAAQRSLSTEEGRRLNELLERGLSVAFEFLERSRRGGGGQTYRQSRLNIKSLCSYALAVQETVFRRLLVVGAESKAEQEREAERWRDTFAAYRAEITRDAEQRRLQEARAQAERDEGGRRLLDRFTQSRLERPLPFLDADVQAARDRALDDLVAGEGDGMGLTGMEAGAALAAMDVGEDGGISLGDFAG